jgi:hypothetical protein
MNYPDDSPAPSVSSQEPALGSPVPTAVPPMPPRAAATSPEEASMLEAFSGGTPAPVGNPAAAAAAQELADADTRVAMSGKAAASGRESAVYGGGRGSWLR